MSLATLQLGTPVLCRHSCRLQRHSGCPRRTLVFANMQPLRCMHGSGEQPEASTSAATMGRRSVLLALTAAPLLARGMPASADTPALVPYEDINDKFSIAVPEGWAKGKVRQAGAQDYKGPTGVRRALVWYPDGPGNLDTNVTVVVNNVAADYQSLGSFGTAEQFGMNLVASMDRSYLQRGPLGGSSNPVQLASLVGTKDLSGAYFVDYTVTKPGESKRHLLSVIAMGWNGRYNRLFTVTAQCPDAELPQLEGIFRSVLMSFKAPPKWV
ncbi:hypothetical protein WJX72_002303 [[Myrmecia] bisecta]|uniref:PsbP C-terminal domain-containing protein n=1 Tax=[Myrmecia] bisecta TaxID=41462 RepID=A0AAW1NZC0_9CHLO